MDDYAIDAMGNRVYPGDYVRCLVKQYVSLSRGACKRVKAVSGANLILKNDRSPSGEGPYRADNFEISGRYHPYHHGGVDKRRPRNAYLTNTEMAALTKCLATTEKEEIMLHLAVRVEEGQNYNSVANNINANERPSMISDVSASALKEKVRFRINANPLERWLILSGNTIAESAAPPITFRQW